MTIASPTLDFCTLWARALPFERFVAEATVNRELWRGLYRQARIPAWATTAAEQLGARRLLVLAEDWCNDAVSIVPVLARLAETAPAMELRILRRDEHPEAMDQYLTDGAAGVGAGQPGDGQDRAKPRGAALVRAGSGGIGVARGAGGGRVGPGGPGPYMSPLLKPRPSGGAAGSSARGIRRRPAR